VQIVSKCDLSQLKRKNPLKGKIWFR